MADVSKVRLRQGVVPALLWGSVWGLVPLALTAQDIGRKSIPAAALLLAAPGLATLIVDRLLAKLSALAHLIVCVTILGLWFGAMNQLQLGAWIGLPIVTVSWTNWVVRKWWRPATRERLTAAFVHSLIISVPLVLMDILSNGPAKGEIAAMVLFGGFLLFAPMGVAAVPPPSD